MRLPYYFWLGARGFVAGLAWLGIPSLLLAAGQFRPVLGFVGGVLLTVVMLYVPFAQVQMAQQQRFLAAFEMTRLRAHFRRAPLAFLVALTLTLTFALPLYLLKIEIVPREAAWLPSLVFVVFMFPARVAAGWAYGRASQRTTDAHFVWRWLSRGLMPPLAAAYVLVLFFTQYTSWYGAYSLIEQHAVLTPAPFWHW